MLDNKSSIEEIAEAIYRNPFEQISTMKYIPNFYIEHEQDVTWYKTGLHSPMCNGVSMARFTGDEEQKVKRVIGNFDSEKLPFIWVLDEHSSPQNLSELLIQHGMRQSGEALGMYAFIQSDYRWLNGNILRVHIDRVDDEVRLSQWLDITSKVFGLKDVETRAFESIFKNMGFDSDNQAQNFVARHNENNVGAISLFLGAGVAGLYNLCVKENMRRNGIAKHLLTTALVFAYDRGYRCAILHASEMGKNLYKKMSFEELNKIIYYIK